METKVSHAQTDPNFGYETKGSIDGSASGNYIFGSWFSCPEEGIAQSITVYIKQSGSYTPKIKCAIYEKLAYRSFAESSLVGFTEEWTLTSGWDNWKTFNIVSGGILEATDYWLVFWSNGAFLFYYEYETDKGCYKSQTYNDFPESCILYPIVYKISIYCTYEIEALFDCNYIGLNNTIAGKPTKFSSDWTDLNQSEGLSHNRFSTNNTGVWLNDTWSDSWENIVWAIATKTLNSTVNIIIAFRFYVNDTSGTEYASTICFFPTSKAGGFFPYFGLGALFALMIGLVFGLAISYKKR